MSDINQEVVNFIINNGKLDYKIRIDRLTKRFYAGETIIPGRAVFVDTDGKIYHINNNIESEIDRYAGIAESVDCNNVWTVCTHGLCSVNGMIWQPGVLYYISATGELTNIEPSGFVRKVGVGVNIGRILLMPPLGGSGGGGGIEEIDGGSASSMYTVPEEFDGGGA